MSIYETNEDETYWSCIITSICIKLQRTLSIFKVRSHFSFNLKIYSTKPIQKKKSNVAKGDFDQSTASPSVENIFKEKNISCPVPGNIHNAFNLYLPEISGK